MDSLSLTSAPAWQPYGYTLPIPTYLARYLSGCPSHAHSLHLFFITSFVIRYSVDVHLLLLGLDLGFSGVQSMQALWRENEMVDLDEGLVGHDEILPGVSVKSDSIFVGP